VSTCTLLYHLHNSQKESNEGFFWHVLVQCNWYMHACTKCLMHTSLYHMLHTMYVFKMLHTYVTIFLDCYIYTVFYQKKSFAKKCLLVTQFIENHLHIIVKRCVQKCGKKTHNGKLIMVFFTMFIYNATMQQWEHSFRRDGTLMVQLLIISR